MSDDYRDNGDGTTYSKRCPDCGAWAEADFVDNGIGMQRCSLYGCEACGWTEPASYDEFLKSIDERAA